MAPSTSKHCETGDSPSIVAVIHCPSYDFALVEAAVKRGIELVGGISKFAKENERLLLKPNILEDACPEKCVLTHPAVLRAAVCAFTATGAQVQYGDSPSVVTQPGQPMILCGYDGALAGLSVTRVPFDKCASVPFPEGRTGKQLSIVQSVLDADGVINLPKLKTHALTRMTGAIKNLFGCVPMLVKRANHARHPDVYIFSEMLADVAAFVRPRLHIMDAIEAMEGNGPQNGTPKKLGVVLVSTDPVALDTIACKLIGLDPAHVPTISAAEKIGIGQSDIGMIHLVGDPIEPFIDPSFDVVRMPPVAHPQATPFDGIRRWLLPRPVIDKKKCIGCGRCVAICPLAPPALSQKTEQLPPAYDYGRCIRCYCCQEMCQSDAISVKQQVTHKFLLLSIRLLRRIIRTRFRGSERK